MSKSRNRNWTSFYHFRNSYSSRIQYENEPARRRKEGAATVQSNPSKANKGSAKAYGMSNPARSPNNTNSRDEKANDCEAIMPTNSKAGYFSKDCGNVIYLRRCN